LWPDLKALQFVEENVLADVLARFVEDGHQSVEGLCALRLYHLEGTLTRVVWDDLGLGLVFEGSGSHDVVQEMERV
jgi:hypothetical protein